MKKQELIETVNQLVTVTEFHLTQLDVHIAEAARLEAEIVALGQSEKDILAASSEKSNDKKLKPLLEARAKLDIAQSNLEQTKVEIAVATEDAIQAAITAHHGLNSLRDGLVASRRQRVGDEIKSHFVKNAHLEIERLLVAAVAVKEIDEIDRAVFVASRPELGITNARKLRETFSLFVAFADTEPVDLDIIA